MWAGRPQRASAARRDAEPLQADVVTRARDRAAQRVRWCGTAAAPESAAVCCKLRDPVCIVQLSRPSLVFHGQHEATRLVPYFPPRPPPTFCLRAPRRRERSCCARGASMGSCSSKEEAADDGPVGGGLDGWSVGHEASVTSQQAAGSMRHSLIARSDLAASKGRGLVGNEVGPEAIRHDDIRLQDLSSSQASSSGRSKGALQPQRSFERRPGGAPTERQSSFERRPGGGIQPKHSFPACVLCNFDAVAPDVPGVPQIELRVTRGELVTVEIHP